MLTKLVISIEPIVDPATRTRLPIAQKFQLFPSRRVTNSIQVKLIIKWSHFSAIPMKKLPANTPLELVVDLTCSHHDMQLLFRCFIPAEDAKLPSPASTWMGNLPHHHAKITWNILEGMPGALLSRCRFAMSLLLPAFTSAGKIFICVQGADDRIVLFSRRTLVVVIANRAEHHCSVQYSSGWRQSRWASQKEQRLRLLRTGAVSLWVPDDPPGLDLASACGWSEADGWTGSRSLLLCLRSPHAAATANVS